MRRRGGGLQPAFRRAALALALSAAMPARAQSGLTGTDAGAGSESVAPGAAAQAAAAAQKEAQDAEAEVIELRREIEDLERQRAAYDDVRRRLDDLEARASEWQRRADAAVAPPSAPPSPISFRDGGIEIRSPDNGFFLHPRARVQAIYTGEVASQGAQDLAPPDVSSFSVARAELILEGHVAGPSFQYRIQLEATGPDRVLDAYVAWRPRRSFTIAVGQLKVPYGLQRQYWEAELELVDFSTATAAFSLERDVGLMVTDRLIPGRLTLEAAVLNGAGEGLANDNIDLAYALRVVATPFGPLPATEGDIEGHRRPLVSIGVSGYFNLVPTDVRVRLGDPRAPTDLDGDGRTDNVAVWQGAAELRAIWRGASLQAEAFHRIEDLGVAGTTRTYSGGYVQAGYFLLPHRLEIAGRIAGTGLPLYGATAEQHLLAGTKLYEQTAGIGAYVRGHRIKLQMDYSHLASPDAQTVPTAHRVRVGFQAGF
jgi:phosphate-selective porin OprO and OprP